MSKALFIEEHEKAIEAYLEEHPNATDEEAYEATADLAYDNLRERFADMADAARQRAKDEQ